LKENPVKRQKTDKSLHSDSEILPNSEEADDSVGVSQDVEFKPIDQLDHSEIKDIDFLNLDNQP